MITIDETPCEFYYLDGNTIVMNGGLMVASTTVMGGTVAWATGGDFLQGAMQGMTIGLFNYAMHDDENGSTPLKVSVVTNKAGTCEFTVIGSRLNTGKRSALAVSAGINTVLDVTGSSLKRNSGNSTVGSNYKFYWHAAGSRGFYGNQYVDAVRLTHIGKRITKVTGPVGIVMSGHDIYEGFQMDGGQVQSIGYNTVRATAKVAGGWAGVKVGGIIGAGVGSLPGAIIGGIIGGVGGSFGGSDVGVFIVDKVYGQ